MSLPATAAASTRIPFDIRRTQRSMISALLEARKTFGGKTVACNKQSIQRGDGNKKQVVVAAAKNMI